MTLTIVGAGYVGLTSAAVFADLGHCVYLLRRDPKKIESLLRGDIGFFEPGLSEIVQRTLASGLLRPTTNSAEAIKHSEVVFICVGTPPLADGSADMTQVLDAAQMIAKNLDHYTVIVNKSTVPIGTADRLTAFIKQHTTTPFDIASCPEFLREGKAVHDLYHPDRIVIGAESIHARAALLKLHSQLPGKRIVTDVRSAEMSKYASNAFLATKISFINEIANLCDEVGANVDDVASIMGADPRIGSDFLRAGIGFGGSCFPKDTRALHSIALNYDYEFKLIKSVVEVNQAQRRHFLRKIRKILGELSGKTIGVLGLAFKNNTDDVRESAAIDIIQYLLNHGAIIRAFDPKAEQRSLMLIPELKTCPNPQEVFINADAVLILTEWEEFRVLPWSRLRDDMKQPVVIDGRNMLRPDDMALSGYQYYSVGRPMR